nr:MAG: hypothetical protein [uncultured archaeon]
MGKFQFRKIKRKKVLVNSLIEPGFDEDGNCLECGSPSPDSEVNWCCSACREAGRTLKGHFKCNLLDDFCQCEPKEVLTEMIRTTARGSKGALYTYTYD